MKFKEEAFAYRVRGRMVNEAEIRELRATQISVKLRQLSSLMESASMFTSSRATAEERCVRERWQRLRKAYRAESK
jgi:hypothetical protein